MKLDFNETTILIQTIEELEKNNKSIDKNSLISTLYSLLQNTNKDYVFIRLSLKSLAFKIEQLSEQNIHQICLDIKNGQVAATVCYSLPNA